MIRLFSARVSAVAALISVAFVFSPLADAQGTDTSASSPKQVRKAQRKAARANRTAELKQLESNGYKPGKDQADYPQDIQNAERKSGPTAHPAPASGQ
ncbi:hypothetical protein DR64_4452 [Paraburkholderia xenovorans LB400]|uniref:DUF4148 domain-containing protein n=1 Tax=Paraburkholderia xenovorans (strain LB400) TaxID=266265 RepID=Q13PX6_PARXL|nr:DUF4148 domain-containing protein [Paraburkholderia xenovorans]ABE33863.1 hypothetical protein Bxe_B2123 [Paraburkholderia xenovorans LB400]AIP38126.1 hypothetical protein DR64_4452 [Paraburkholderia xenovorans LB400]